MNGKADKQTTQRYSELVKKLTPKSPLGQGLLRAFWVGGVICIIGQLIHEAGSAWLHLDEKAAGAFTSIAMVFLGSFLTGLGLYDRIGKYAGGGSIVPITGFANSIVASAMEFRREGLVMGVGARLFQVAGPVLVYGVGSSVIVGVIAWIVMQLGG
ncbi:MAG: stage V sporulation protein AC [Oscillospiraceae bacterium]|jgi:stage V sporulation protein AC|nr:stage V sporulation protein AC [Oscillospiraceae bacterium]